MYTGALCMTLDLVELLICCTLSWAGFPLALYVKCSLVYILHLTKGPASLAVFSSPLYIPCPVYLWHIPTCLPRIWAFSFCRCSMLLHRYCQRRHLLTLRTDGSAGGWISPLGNVVIRAVVFVVCIRCQWYSRNENIRVLELSSLDDFLPALDWICILNTYVRLDHLRSKMLLLRLAELEQAKPKSPTLISTPFNIHQRFAIPLNQYKVLRVSVGGASVSHSRRPQVPLVMAKWPSISQKSKYHVRSTLVLNACN